MYKKRERKINPWALIIVFCLAVGIVFGVLFYFKNKNSKNEASAEPHSENSDSTFVISDNTKTEQKPDIYDFSPMANKWLSGISGTASIVIYDLDNDQVLVNINGDKDWNTASLYKLFVVYEGYLRLERGEWNKNDLTSATDPVTGKTMTYAECLDAAIRSSYSPCAEYFWYSAIGQNALDTIIEQKFSITNSTISKLTSNANDITKMMKIYYEHEGLSEDSVAAIQDSMLNQPPSWGYCANYTCDWRRGLPSGFTDAKVYNKVGWDWTGNYWNVYHDTAIAEIDDAKGITHHYIITVMTSRVDFTEIAAFGSAFQYVLKNSDQ